ncbi:glycosyltransferase [Corynebacterium sp. HMSC065D07]|uniref:glycosyltransferase n=1 Tax=Corynebacterium sp. HMSC065D07 TaxID=1739264 RepID=UPI0009F3E5FE|nr:glycosyltransferase [Corynebacterium sp. HMSC065D07]
MSTYRPGISIIIPSFAPVSTQSTNSALVFALTSLVQQTVCTELIEVLVVFNGPGALRMEPDLSERFPDLDLRVLRTTSPGAGRARNLGIACASRSFVTFLDDDDALEPQFIATGLEHAEDGVCVLLPIHDSVDGSFSQENSLNTRILGLRGTTVPVATAPWALGFNASKVIPTELAQRYRYKETLRSGEDVAYFAHLLEVPGMLLRVPSRYEGTAYLRTIRDRSVSRQAEGFDFNVTQRLECMAQLRAIREYDTKTHARQKLEDAQFGFVETYLRDHPSEIRRAIETAISLKVSGLDWGELRPDKAKRLVFSYCFPPYADTSANVTAKVIRQDAELVDVFSANMSRVREYDESARLIVDPYLAHVEELDVVPSFSHWRAICSYASQAARKAHKQAKSRGGYESMYSRALWSGSHVAAALFKSKHPETYWQAEFSDPLSVGVDGGLRPGKLTRGVTTYRLRKMIERTDWADIQIATHFELTELVTFLYADEVIFTNANQQEVMLERYPADLRRLVQSKSRIRHQTVPTKEMYSLVGSDYRLDPALINIAYFGNFYVNRGIDDILTALAHHPARDRFRLHIFTSNPNKLRRDLWGHPAEECLCINGYLPYLQFLNLSTRFDVLVVNDTDTTGSSFGANPFLPSKYADYAGSGVDVWGVVTDDSPLSKLPLAFSTHVGNTMQAHNVLDQLLRQAE